MAFNETTVVEALRAINRNEFVLPAIQREFVWSAERVCQLFDSLMQGYPVGQLLFWQIEAENASNYRFYGFMRDYHERDDFRCSEVRPQHGGRVMGVLDGQQRLTALNIGLHGSMAVKKAWYRWSSDHAFPKRRLFLDLTAPDRDGADGTVYDFRFLESAKDAEKPEGTWFPVYRITDMETGPDMQDWVLDQGLEREASKLAYKRLDRLHRVVHTEKPLAFFVEKSQNLDRVLQIFIRVNRQGMVLSYSDLLLSIATAQWTERDARDEVHGLVDDMNKIEPGFDFSKDFVLKAGLMLLDIASVGFKVDNFGRENMGKLEAGWDKVREALLLTVRLVADMGFGRDTLRADSALLPVAYYLFQRGLDERYLTAGAAHEDRPAIKGWLARSFLKASGVWGSGLDTLLTALRDQIREHGAARFPVPEIEREMARRGRPLTFNDDEIEDLTAIAYGDKRVFPLLSLIYPFVDTRHHTHIDHIYPRSRFTAAKLRRDGFDEEQAERLHGLVDQVPNLQLLEGGPNQEKGKLFPAGWLRTYRPDETARHDYMDRHDLRLADGTGEWIEVGDDAPGFERFFEARRSQVRSRIRDVLATPKRGEEVLADAAE